MKIELLNDLLSIGIGACVWIIFACGTYVIKTIACGIISYDKYIKKAKELEKQDIIKEYEKNKEK